jgi:alkane 1-monooxygenase
MKITFDSLILTNASLQIAQIKFGKLKYFVVSAFPLAAFVAFTTSGFLTLSPAILIFGIVPVLELFLPADNTNFNTEEKTIRTNTVFFDRFLYWTVPVLVGVSWLFLFTISDKSLTNFDFFGRIFSMGVVGGIAINLGHELGHRTSRFEQFLGEISLLISLENHFLPYHNLGHHKNAATPNDPATARRNESVYTFWIRSQFGSYRQAWQFETEKQRRNKRGIFSLHNRMVSYTIAQIVLLLTILLAFGLTTMLAFTASAIVGKLILETVNYIEHYGLVRKMEDDGKYERVLPQHSWNSDHVLGRAILFELSRHSDHHFKASKPYQVLDSLPQSPQMPTGYPGMMIFSLFSPIWFWYMNKRIDEIKEKSLAVGRAKRLVNFTGKS